MNSIVDATKEGTFTKYGAKFQLATLSLLIQDKVFAKKVCAIIKPEYFDNKYSQWICEQILEQIETYRSAPSFEDLKTIIEAQTGGNAKLYLTTLNSIEKVELDRIEFVQTEAEKFCFTKFALEQVEIEKTKIMLGDFEGAKQTAFAKYKTTNGAYKEADIKKDYQLALSIDNLNPVPTILPSVNKVTKGGAGAGTLNVIMAQSNFGKSMFLMANARNAAHEGKNVVYFSLETDYLQLMQRFLAGYTNIPQDLLKNNKSLIEAQMAKLSGNLKVVELKSIHAKVETLKAKIDDYRSQGFFPDMIVVDGLNQVKAPKGANFTNSNDKFEYLAEELRDWSKELEIPVYVAFQSNRGGFNVEIADEQNIGKAIEVYQVCDTMLMFTQTPQMLEIGECNVQLLKNRLGPKGLMLRLHYDPAFGQFNELESISRTMILDGAKRNTINKGLDVISNAVNKKKMTS